MIDIGWDSKANVGGMGSDDQIAKFRAKSKEEEIWIILFIQGIKLRPLTCHNLI